MHTGHLDCTAFAFGQQVQAGPHSQLSPHLQCFRHFRHTFFLSSSDDDEDDEDEDDAFGMASFDLRENLDSSGFAEAELGLTRSDAIEFGSGSLHLLRHQLTSKLEIVVQNSWFFLLFYAAGQRPFIGEPSFCLLLDGPTYVVQSAPSVQLLEPLSSALKCLDDSDVCNLGAYPFSRGLMISLVSGTLTQFSPFRAVKKWPAEIAFLLCL